MNTRKLFLFKLVGFFVAAGLILTSCYKDDPEGAVAGCESCHTNYAHLQKIYSPDTTAPAGGCGGTAPHYEPYDRVYMGGDGFDAYKASGHYPIGCTGCHGGVDNTADKKHAHSGNFMKHPSDDYKNKCGTCHQDIANNFDTSIHQGTGQKRKVTMRSGLDGAHQFDDLPAHQIEGYNANCATCHGTCGNCHVVRPKIAGGGLAKGHNFTKTPDMLNVCVSCHTSRGGHAYLGVSPGTEADVHLKKAGFTCMDCHTGHELHGNGEPVDQRYAYSELPSCEDCHAGLQDDNLYHSMHYDDFNCQVCHSQDYNNCGSCHVHGEGARIPAYMDYKIAMNPIPDVKSEYKKFVLVRRTLGAPDNWKEYGVEEYANFDAFPTYNYTTPHNILRWTSRTDTEGASCMTNCHIKNVDGELMNKNLYLFEENLLEWEKGASSHITVDGKIPDSWIQ